jgi:hypothetical protein
MVENWRLTLVGEVFNVHMDAKARRMFVLRVFGYSWTEIGRRFGISAHNAEVQLGYGLNKARKRLMGKRPRGGREAAGDGKAKGNATISINSRSVPLSYIGGEMSTEDPRPLEVNRTQAAMRSPFPSGNL